MDMGNELSCWIIDARYSIPDILMLEQSYYLTSHFSQSCLEGKFRFRSLPTSLNCLPARFARSDEICSSDSEAVFICSKKVSSILICGFPPLFFLRVPLATAMTIVRRPPLVSSFSS